MLYLFIKKYNGMFICVYGMFDRLSSFKVRDLWFMVHGLMAHVNTSYFLCSWELGGVWSVAVFCRSRTGLKPNK